MRSFLKSSCLVPFVWFQIVPGMLIYFRINIIIFKAYPLRGLHLSSLWSQKRCLALEIYFLSVFFGNENKHIRVVAALRMSIWFQCREHQHHFLHVAAVGVEMQSLRLLLEASTSWGKKSSWVLMFSGHLVHFTHVEGCVSQSSPGFGLYNEIKCVMQYHFLNLLLTCLWVFLYENWTEVLHGVVSCSFLPLQAALLGNLYTYNHSWNVCLSNNLHLKKHMQNQRQRSQVFWKKVVEFWMLVDF